jgi:hypothetical protein
LNLDAPELAFTDELCRVRDGDVTGSIKSDSLFLAAAADSLLLEGTALAAAAPLLFGDAALAGATDG